MEKKHDKECEMRDGYLSCDCPRIGPKPQQHTPGPWTLHEDGVTVLYEGLPLAVVGWTEITGEDRANSRLIAAAPELLEAVKYLKGLLSGWYEYGHEPTQGELAREIENLTAAIVKAEGR